jgi:hypothetical protein
VIREFICSKCGHTVVVNPNLPADYIPNICTLCWDAGEAERQTRQLALFTRFDELLKKLDGIFR